MTYINTQSSCFGNFNGISSYATATSSVINCPYTTQSATAYGYCGNVLTAQYNLQTQTWSAWNSGLTTITNTANTITWNAWCEAYPRVVQGVVQQEADAAAIAAERRRIEVHLEERDKINARAKAWLVEMLSDNQREEFAKSESFELRTDRHRYRIKPGQRVEELDEKGIVVARLCIHPPEPLPTCDIAVCQKLWIEGNEDEFRRVANRRAA